MGFFPLGLVSAAAAMILGVVILYPKLPTYTFWIRSVVPQWHPLEGVRKVALLMEADMEMTNDNHVDLDIYALTFDIYYPRDLFGNLPALALPKRNTQYLKRNKNSRYLLGRIQDTRQQSHKEPCTTTASTNAPHPNYSIHSTSTLPVNSSLNIVNTTFSNISKFPTKSSVSSTTATKELLCRTPQKHDEQPIWHLQSHKKMASQQNKFTMLPTIGDFGVQIRMMMDILLQWGMLHMISVGVIHVKVGPSFGQILQDQHHAHAHSHSPLHHENENQTGKDTLLLTDAAATAANSSSSIFAFLKTKLSSRLHRRHHPLQLPLTIQIVCDNILDLWNMEIQGSNCHLHHIPFIGWKNISHLLNTL